MGCGASREKEVGLHCPLEHFMENVGLEGVDTIFSRAEPVLKSIEEIRELVVDRFDSAKIWSGATAIREELVDLTRVFECVLWGVSVEADGDIYKNPLKITAEPPFLEYIEKSKSIKAVNKFAKYVSGFYNQAETLIELTAQISELCSEICDNVENLTDQVNEYSKEEPSKQHVMLNRVVRNSNRIKKAAGIVPDLNKAMNMQIRSIPHLIDMYNDDNFIRSVNDNAKKAIKLKLKQPWEITWHLIKPEDRAYAHPKEANIRGRQRRKIKKEMKKHIAKKKENYRKD